MVLWWCAWFTVVQYNPLPDRPGFPASSTVAAIWFSVQKEPLYVNLKWSIDDLYIKLWSSGRHSGTRGEFIANQKSGNAWSKSLRMSTSKVLCRLVSHFKPACLRFVRDLISVNFHLLYILFIPVHHCYFDHSLTARASQALRPTPFTPDPCVR